MYDNPITVEMLLNEKIQRMRAEGLRSQEYHRAGVGGAGIFDTLKPLFQGGREQISRWITILRSKAAPGSRPVA